MVPIQIDWLEVLGGYSSSPDCADTFCPASAPAPRAGGRRRVREAPEATTRQPSVDAPAKEDGREGESSTASAAKKSRRLDVEKEDHFSTCSVKSTNHFKLL
ncbi:unnamed protein product [Urochloa humidicola]